MKQRHKESAKQAAKATLAAMNIAIGQDFHTLNTAQVELLLDEAKRVRYQKPANANGSKARYFHARLQRQASAKI